MRHIDAGVDLTGGACVLILHRDSCPQCREVIAGWGRKLRENPGQRVVLVALPEAGSAAPGPEPQAPGFVHGSLPRDREWFARTPVVVRLDGGRVVAVETFPPDGH